MTNLTDEAAILHPVRPGEAFDCVVLSVEINGRVASAKVRETHGSEVAIDYFHLLNDNGHWSIVSKVLGR